MRGAAAHVPVHIVGRVDDPEAGGALVHHENAPNGPHHRHQVVPDRVEALGAVLGEDGVPARVEDHVVLHQQVVHAVDRDAAVERVVHAAVLHKALGNVSH